jgi:folate-binding protein YgfZ
MPSASLPDRALILISGPDAEHFLQNILTTDLDALKSGVAKPGALLAPQGKILFDFLISRTGTDGFRLDCRADIADDFVRRLMLYRLRAKAEISKQEQVFVIVEWQSDSGASQADSTASENDSTVVDTRFAPPARVMRHYGNVAPAEDDIAGWHAFRAAQGIAESGADYTLGDAFPHDVLLDQTGGVGFKKGCYIGQEVVSRMQHRGTARRRVLIAAAERHLPPAGTEILANGRAVGVLGSVAGITGMAIARIDRVKEAMDAGMPLEADGVPLTLTIPAFATFTFPQDTAAEGT